MSMDVLLTILGVMWFCGFLYEFTSMLIMIKRKPELIEGRPKASVIVAAVILVLAWPFFFFYGLHK